ncbi:TPA: hypothetical protein DCX66_03445 [Candidatus Nomurabacteria bacterium]|uniref:Uncharacterized protein n=1 Tax=Candidatus Nomurabacteria bacterium GW2011_GWE1_35_16 TaxID=1618761 RepID=A0A0G0EI24_9BACT|nr:MAG: hypothetical protein UR55_C0001G0061 [Candidatus Nomurabacteria bacterium GW2011_GWF1_34_20]KKP63770.1 MAG: hypothetical protein UR57_C0001G0061 [Candidatus Nomurabacteria bacterium GW2011_GWE2_34_25]KKP66982.1 MAG: hypothetical protein UR64_C0001G0061 [Candidatus Nomurabacteria bacterium GW2011_GWE1_35_16]HAE36804.1 hypothetical protein [Candidatus Nomurabacteria bacterium]HAX65493.1 hypothetical protein [Candidatus Nomurabacteria bacterium]
MESFLLNTAILLVFIIAISLLKVLIPEISYELKTSLILGISAMVVFSLIFLIFVTMEKEKLDPTWPTIYLLISSGFVGAGAKTVALKTVSGVFSKINNQLLGRVEAGLNWADPIYEEFRANIDGIANTSIDLQELEIEIKETPEMHTATRGIKAKVKNVVIMLQIIEEQIPQLFEIEGGKETIKHRILSFVNLFFLDKIGQMEPLQLDEDKGDTLRKLGCELKTAINKFCKDNHYPFEIPEHAEVTIGDTELEPEYYKVLAKKEFTRLEQDGLDVEATRIRSRLLDLGKQLLPKSNENEQLKAAMVALKITPKSISEQTYGVSPEVSLLLVELAGILKK